MSDGNHLMLKSHTIQVVITMTMPNYIYHCLDGTHCSDSLGNTRGLLMVKNMDSIFSNIYSFSISDSKLNVGKYLSYHTVMCIDGKDTKENQNHIFSHRVKKKTGKHIPLKQDIKGAVRIQPAGLMILQTLMTAR